MCRSLTHPQFLDVISQTFYDNTTNVYCYMRASKTKGSDFDPERQAGYVLTLQNPIIVQAIVRDIQPEKLVIKEMGLTESGAIELLIKAKDIDTIKLAERIVYENVEYYKYQEAVGTKFLIWKRPFGYYRIWLFRKAK
jgi:hypothetical protein